VIAGGAAGKCSDRVNLESGPSSRARTEKDSHPKRNALRSQLL
jgi:hypothetical protein